MDQECPYPSEMARMLDILPVPNLRCPYIPMYSTETVFAGIHDANAKTFVKLAHLDPMPGI
jgi:hypothetical protein